MSFTERQVLKERTRTLTSVGRARFGKTIFYPPFVLYTCPPLSVWDRLPRCLSLPRSPPPWSLYTPSCCSASAHLSLGLSTPSTALCPGSSRSRLSSPFRPVLLHVSPRLSTPVHRCLSARVLLHVPVVFLPRPSLYFYLIHCCPSTVILTQSFSQSLSFLYVHISV